MKFGYYLYLLAGAVIPKIPPKAGYAVCRFLGGVLYQFNRPMRANIQQNLERILGSADPPAEFKRRVRATFDYILYNYFDLFRLPQMDEKSVAELVSVSGWEHIEAALAKGRGIVMTSAHLGNIEVVLFAMLQRGLSITIPVERVEPPELFEYISALRMSKGLKLTPIDGPLFSLVRALKKGEVVGIAGDRDITGTGQVVQFFGHPAHLPDGHIRLALKMGAPLVVGFSRRNEDYSYQAYFLPPIFLPDEGSEEERVAAGLEFIIKEMEQAIRRTPEQWTVTVSIWAE